MTEDIEAVFRKIEHWHQGSIAKFKIMCRDGKGFGIAFDGTAKPRPVSLWAKLMSEELARGCSSPSKLRLLYTPGIHSRFEISKVWRRTKILIRRTRGKNSQAFQKKPKVREHVDKLAKGGCCFE